MVILEYSDVLSQAQTLGIIGTLLLTLYFSMREVRGLSVDMRLG